MSDTYRRSRAIKQAVMQFYQPRPAGHKERHLHTLVALICGLAGSQRAYLSSIADHDPSHGADQESLITRLHRFLKNDKTTTKTSFLPIAKALLANLAQQPLILVMDGSVVGRGCVCVMLSVVCHGRALPLVWIVVKGKKGLFPQQAQYDLLAQSQELIPVGTDMTVLGDGEFDSTDFQAALRTLKWKDVSRTAPNLLITVEGRICRSGAMAPDEASLRHSQPVWASEYAGVVGGSQ